MELSGCSNTYLPVEMIEQILLLLPPNSIGQCRSLSKQWQNLLSSSQFIKAHASIITSRTLKGQSVSIFAYKSWTRFSLTNDNQVTASGAHHNLDLPSSTYLVGSCDGLVLVLKNASQTSLINPTTRHTREIPSLITGHVVNHMTTRTRITLYGVGFDSVINDYKVIFVSYICNQVDDSSEEVFVHIYSVNNGAWKSCVRLPNYFGYRCSCVWPIGVYVERCIHWLIRRVTDDIVVIVAFDVEEEKLCQVPNPTHDSFKPQLYSYRLDVLAGCLCISIMMEGYLNVWVMNKYGIQESWSRIARIGRVEEGWLVPLCLVGQQNLVLQLFHIAKFVKSVSYNLVEKMLKDVDIHGIREMNYRTVPLAETMVSPYGMRGE